MYVFASDFDGTLKQRGTISKYTLDQIESFRDKGHKFGIVTGRNLSMLAPEVKLFSIPLDFVIGANGGIVKIGESVIQRSLMNFEVVQQVLQIAKEQGVGTIGISDGYQYGNIVAKPSLHWKKLAKYFAFLSQRRNSKVILEKQEVTTIFLHDEARKIKQVYQAINQIEGIEAYVNNHEYLDIVAKGVSKGAAIETLMEYYQCHNLYVIGDSLNDLSMIEKYRGFCVENACDEVKKIASHSFKEVGDALQYIKEEVQNETTKE